MRLCSGAVRVNQKRNQCTVLTCAPAAVAVVVVAVAPSHADMRATSETLALRQSDSLAVLSQELFCSPDIIRQVGILIGVSGRSCAHNRHSHTLVGVGLSLCVLAAVALMQTGNNGPVERPQQRVGLLPLCADARWLPALVQGH